MPAICSVCKREMVAGGSCKVTGYVKKKRGKIFPADINTDDEDCGDCNAGTGKYHHPGCD